MGLNNEYKLIAGDNKIIELNSNSNNNNNKQSNITLDETHIEGVYKTFIFVPILKGFSNILPFKLAHIFNTNEYESIIDGINQVYKSNEKRSIMVSRLFKLLFALVFLGLGLVVTVMVLSKSIAITIATPFIFFGLFFASLITLIIISNKNYTKGLNNIHQQIDMVNSTLKDRNIQFTFYQKIHRKSVTQHLKVSFPCFHSQAIQNKTITIPTELNNQNQQQQQQVPVTYDYMTPLNQSPYTLYNQLPILYNQQQQQQSANLNYSIDENELSYKV